MGTVIGILDLNRMGVAIIILNCPVDGAFAFNRNATSYTGEVLVGDSLKVCKLIGVRTDSGRSHWVNAKRFGGKVHWYVRVKGMSA